MALVANLVGTVSDDGLPDPPAAVTHVWTKISGPGTVIFGDDTLLETTATFSEAGTYVLRLTASDSVLSDFDEVQIIVTEEEEPFTPPLPGDPEYFFGDMKAYILWDGAHVCRTWDIKDNPPVWELVDTGITGTIMDGHYIHVDAETVGMWLLTSDGVFVCMNIMASPPVWTHVLTLAMIRAEEVQLVDNPSVFGAFNHYKSEPGYLIVATMPETDTGSSANDYMHAYSWHTHDYGATWATVDMFEFTDIFISEESCYAWCKPYAIDIYASELVIWMFRTVNTLVKAGSIFNSVDGGHTWTEEPSFTAHSEASILAPFPDIDGPSYVSRGNSLAATWPSLWRSYDGWITAEEMANPTGYNRGMPWELRINARTFDPNYIYSYWQKDGTDDTALLKSEDAGVTWDLLRDDDRNQDQVQTPNGWPPDVNVWVDISRASSLNVASTFVVRYTNDHFVTMQDKRGNLSTIITDWVGGLGNNGFALPKVAPNV